MDSFCRHAIGINDLLSALFGLDEYPPGPAADIGKCPLPEEEFGPGSRLGKLFLHTVGEVENGDQSGERHLVTYHVL